MNIECPHCDTGNTIEFAENIHCHKCQKSFAGFSFKKYKTSILGTGAVLLLGAYGGHKLDGHFLEPKRYSTAAIYEIVDFCVNPDSPRLADMTKPRLAKACVCALDKAMEKIPEAEMATRAKEFKVLFWQNLKRCDI